MVKSIAVDGMEEKVSASEEYKKQMKDILAFASFTVKTDFPQLGEDAFTLGMIEFE